MAITASEIHNQSFSIDRKGYDVDEVDVFLEHVADEIDELNDHIRRLENELDDTRYGAVQETMQTSTVMAVADTDMSADIAELEAAVVARDARIADLEQQLEEKRADDNAIAQALIIAQRSADDILVKANAQATDTIADARDEAQRIIDRANGERQDVIDAIRKLQDDRELARDEYSDLLKDIIADASRKLASIGGAIGTSPRPMVYDDMMAADTTSEFEIDEYVEQAPVYAAPQTPKTVVAAATPVASPYEKDLSGFGDVDDVIDFEEID